MIGRNMNPEVVAEAQRRYRETSWGERSQLVAQLADAWGVSVAQVYRYLGPVSERKRRSDAGASSIAERDLWVMAKWLVSSQRKTGKILGDLELGREELLHSGLISPESAQISLSTWARLMRQKGISKWHLKAPSLAVEMDARHPNQWHVVDASIGVLFYLDAGRLKFRRIDLMDPKNKPETFAREVTRRLLLVRWVCVDYYSSATFVDYREAGGENTADLISFLNDCWQPKGDTRLPMHGVPFGLYADQGAPQKSAAFTNLMKTLQVRVVLHESSHTRRDAPAARATGLVESTMRVWEHEFEALWRHAPPTGGLQQVREQCRDFLLAFNSTERYQPRRADTTRSGLWSAIEEKHLRLPPDFDAIKRLAVSNPASRVLDEYGRISWQGAFFKIPQCSWYPGEELLVQESAFDSSSLLITNPRTGESLDAIRLQRRANGRSSAAVYVGEAQDPSSVSARQPLHTAAKLRRELEEDVKAESGIAAPGAMQSRLGAFAETVKVEFVPKVGVEILPRCSGRRVDLMDVILMAAERLGPLQAEEREWLTARIGDSRIDELDGLDLVEELATARGLSRQVLGFKKVKE